MISVGSFQSLASKGHSDTRLSRKIHKGIYGVYVCTFVRCNVCTSTYLFSMQMREAAQGGIVVLPAGVRQVTLVTVSLFCGQANARLARYPMNQATATNKDLTLTSLTTLFPLSKMYRT